jgi:hypothetical protein
VRDAAPVVTAADESACAQTPDDGPERDAVSVVTAWEYGTGLIKSGDLAGGLEVLQAAIAHRPADATLRKELRKIECELRPKDGPSDEGVSAILTAIVWEIREAKRKRTNDLIDWDRIDRAVESGLAVAPWEADLHLELGHASRARGHWDVARFAYQCALDVAPERADAREALASLPKC